MAKKKRSRRPAKPSEPASPTAWIRRIKYRALAWVVAIVLATIATVVLAGVPAWPAVGVAVAAACVSVGKLTSRLLKPTCLECGHDLTGVPGGGAGVVCPDCGSVSSPGLVQLAQMGDPQGRDEDERA
jgi:hypothetical protein